MNNVYEQYGVQPQNVTGWMSRSRQGLSGARATVQKPLVGPYQVGGFGPMSYPQGWADDYWRQMNQQMTRGRVRPQQAFTQGGMSIAGGAGGRRWQAGGVTSNAFAAAPRFQGGFANAARKPKNGGMGSLGGGM